MRADLAARLGQIRWNLHPLWGLAPRVDHKNDGLVESNLLSLSYGQVVRKDINEIGGLRPDSYETYNIIAPGDTVLRMTDLQNDQRSIRTGLATERGIITSAYITVRPDGDKVEPRFLHSVLRAYDIKKTFYEMGVGVRQTLKYAELADLPIPLPPRDTQRAIADYLDRETGEIDAMRAKLNELESTLLKRRRSVILEATCQGGPEEGRSARPSSFEVSKHEWQIVPLKFAVDSAQTGVWGQEANGGSDDVPCVRVADFDRLRIRVTEAPTIRRIKYKDRVRCELQKGDLLVEKSGGSGKNPVGAVAAYVGDFPAVCSNFILRLRCRENHYPRFWLYVLHGSYIAGRTWNYVRQTTGIQNLDVNGFMSMSHPAPDFDEQRRIADHLDEATSRIDAMLAKIDELKALLVERRAALITDVVTGRKKIPA